MGIACILNAPYRLMVLLHKMTIPVQKATNPLRVTRYPFVEYLHVRLMKTGSFFVGVVVRLVVG